MIFSIMSIPFILSKIACHPSSASVHGTDPSQRSKKQVSAVGLRLVGFPAPLEAFIAYVRQPTGAMPPSGAKISAQEFLDIYTWVRSIAPSPDVKTIDLLKPDSK